MKERRKIFRKKRGKNKRSNRKGQVWIETVIYTLIALIMIGAVLAFIKPKIQEIQDKAIIDQSIQVLDYIDGQIKSAALGGEGNRRVTEFVLKKGTLEIDARSESEKLIFTMEDSRSTYSEPGIPVRSGNIEILTEKKGRLNTVRLTISYIDKYDFFFNGDQNGRKTITKSSTPNKISMENMGVKEIEVPPGSTLDIVACPAYLPFPCDKDDNLGYTKETCYKINKGAIQCTHLDKRTMINFKLVS